MRIEPLCSPRARCYTLRFVGVPAATCEYCWRAERIVNVWARMRATLATVGVLALLLGCGGEHGGHRDRDAGELDQADAGAAAWLCYCAGSRAITCTAGEPICSAADPSKRVAKSEHTTCSCTRAGECVRDADCIDVR